MVALNPFFLLEPERAHALALHSLKLAHRLGLTRVLPERIHRPTQHFGLNFPNPLGLAAGLDKNGDYIDALASLGFGFIEIGTVTPKAQIGNPRPRVFRLRDEQAIINRLGFNNKGMHYVAERLQHTKYQGILGINIGKNFATPLDNAVDDYLAVFKCLAQFASYITINISSPNTEGLRDLQQASLLSPLLAQLKQAQHQMQIVHQRYIPLLVKLSPDMGHAHCEAIAEILLDKKIDGIIASNTTISRGALVNARHGQESGGLSGKPLHAQNTWMIKQLYDLLGERIPIIACGGIMDKSSADEKWQAGAVLLQVYTGFIYRGFRLIKEILS